VDTQNRIPVLDLTATGRLWRSFNQAIQTGPCAPPTTSRAGGAGASSRRAPAPGDGKHAVGCNSGTDALVIALRGPGHRPGTRSSPPPSPSSPPPRPQPGGATRCRGRGGGHHDLDPARVEARPSPCAPGPSSRCTCSAAPAPWTTSWTSPGAGGLMVVEDCAQSFGARHRYRPTGQHGPDRNASASSPPRTWAPAATAGCWPPATTSWLRCAGAARCTAAGRNTTTR